MISISHLTLHQLNSIIIEFLIKTQDVLFPFIALCVINDWNNTKKQVSGISYSKSQLFGVLQFFKEEKTCKMLAQWLDQVKAYYWLYSKCVRLKNWLTHRNQSLLLLV